MRHLPATQLLSRLVLATCSAAAFAALDVSHTHAQEEPTEAAASSTAEPQPWQPQLEELREQLASLRQELDELKSRPTPDAVLEIKRLDEKIDLLQSLLSKPDAPTKGDLDAVRDTISNQDNIVENYARGEIRRIDEKVEHVDKSLFLLMNVYAGATVFIFTALIAILTFLGRDTLTAWIKNQIAESTEKMVSQHVMTELRERSAELDEQAKQALDRLRAELEPRAQQEQDEIEP